MPNLPILVVDDQPEMLKTLLRLLDHCGLPGEAAASGDEALGLLNRKSFRMVIADVKMPHMSGMELLQKVKKMAPALPVILITGYGTVDNAVEAMRQGAADYLLKPFSSETLHAVIKKIAGNSNGGQQPHPTIASDGGHSLDKEIITRDPKLLKLLKMAQSVAPSKATCLIQGESGTGKELLAAYIHRHSHQNGKPYLAVNCAALPDTLAESELFGHEKGSFTGAVSRKMGKFELAADGTLVLDEISEMSLSLQAKLLRVLQERQIDRVGGSKPVQMNARIIAISNLDLRAAVKKGQFREDLFFRVNVVPLTVPPLRKRKHDIPVLAGYFLSKYGAVNGKNISKISQAAMAKLTRHDWKGNIRELENAIERAVLIGNHGVLQPEDLLLDTADPHPHQTTGTGPIQVGYTVKEMEKCLIFETLKEVNDNRTHAAQLLGISIRTLRNKLKEYKQQYTPHL